MKPLYVGYFTIGSDYQYEAVECIQTLDAFGLEHDFVGVPNLGDWCLNCSQKPGVILRMMHKHDGRALVYLDVDARVRQRPVLLDGVHPSWSMLVHFRHGVELLSGTIYVGHTAAARTLLGEWASACSEEPNVWDQKHLERIVARRQREGFNDVGHLPPEYCRVFDDPKMGVPVILHTQASRRLKNALRPPAHVQPGRISA